MLLLTYVHPFRRLLVDRRERTSTLPKTTGKRLVSGARNTLLNSRISYLSPRNRCVSSACNGGKRTFRSFLSESLVSPFLCIGLTILIYIIQQGPLDIWPLSSYRDNHV